MDHASEERLGLTPAEIRAIRQRLGLTQVEAGELLGGGPRAFTKYEGGSVKPAASVVALLLLLDANPSTLATLRGGRGRPVPSSSNPNTLPFEVSGGHIQALAPIDFAQLLRRLLSAEASTHGLPLGGIRVPSNITAPDGGEDGYIQWEGGPEGTDFLPCRTNQFQLKCGKILPNAAGREVLTGKGEVKPMVHDVLGDDGCYVLLSNLSFTRKAAKVREERISKSLRDAGLTIKAGQVLFRDADWVAIWVNRHPGTATWVKELTQPGTVRPFHSWNHWAECSEHQLSPLVDDNRLPTLRAAVLGQVTEKRGVIHICGLPGVGKSRLVLEALGPTDERNRSITDLVMYADESGSNAADIRHTAETLAASKSRAIIVVDRCTRETRRALASTVNRLGSRLSLITIEDDTPPTPPDSRTISVPQAASDVTEQIVKNLAPPDLPSEDRRRLAALSRGFPEVALAVVKAWKESAPPLPHTTEDDLVEAFVIGRDSSQSNSLMASARLIAVFGALRVGEGSETQLPEASSFLHGLDVEQLHAAIQCLVRRGIAKERGRLVIFPPSPIVLRLAERQWEEWMPSKWDKILACNPSPELAVLAAHRLALLNTTRVSQKVARHVCRPSGPLDDQKPISASSHAEVLSALVQIDARLVVDLLARSLESVPGLSDVKDEARRHIVRTLEQAAFRADTFEDAADLLLDLAVAENEPYANNATEVFKALFPLLLSKTEAGKSTRFRFLDGVATTTDLRRRAIIVDALVAGIETDHFHRDVGAETHGLRPALHSWHPTTPEEAAEYVSTGVKLLTQFAVADDPPGKAAREGLGCRLRSLIASGLVEVECVEGVVNQVQDHLRTPWKEAIRSLNHFIRVDAEKASSETVDRVIALVKSLQPRDLESKALLLISQYVGDYPPGKDLNLEVAEKLLNDDIRRVAEELVNQPATLKNLLPEASSNPRVNAAWFGECIAVSANSPLDWLEPVKDAFLQAPEDIRYPSLLTGFLYGLSRTHASAVTDFKRVAAQSAQFAPVLPAVCGYCGIKSEDIDLVIEAVRKKLLSPSELMQWTLANKQEEFDPLFDALLDQGSEGFPAAVHLISTYVGDDNDKIDHLWSQVIRVVDGTKHWEDTDFDGMTAYNFEELMKSVLNRGRQDSNARALALKLASTFIALIGSRKPRLVEPLLPILLSDFPEISWPLIGQAIISRDEQHLLFQFALGDMPRPETQPKPAILHLPEETLFAWCLANPDRAPAFVAATVPVLEADETGGPSRSLHPVMRRLIDEFGHSRSVLEAIGRNMGSFSWAGSASSVFRLYREPLLELQNHTKREVRKWARVELESVDDSIRIADERYAESNARSEI